MKLRDIVGVAWLGFGVSASLISWQLVAYLTGSIPDHILPFVRLLSGTQEDVPIAYSWTVRIGFLSVLICFASLVVLIGARLIHWRALHNSSRGEDNLR